MLNLRDIEEKIKSKISKNKKIKIIKKELYRIIVMDYRTREKADIIWGNEVEIGWISW